MPKCIRRPISRCLSIYASHNLWPSGYPSDPFAYFLKFSIFVKGHFQLSNVVLYTTISMEAISNGLCSTLVFSGILIHWRVYKKGMMTKFYSLHMDRIPRIMMTKFYYLHMDCIPAG